MMTCGTQAAARRGTAPAPGGSRNTVRHLDFALTPGEKHPLVAAAEAFETTVSHLAGTAALEAAHRLGYYDGQEAVRPMRGTWRDCPRRAEGETATLRLTLTFSLLQFPLIARAAVEQLGPSFRLSSRGGPAPVQAFVMGATFRYVATRLDTARSTAVNQALPSANRVAAQRFLARLDAAYAARSHAEAFSLPAPFREAARTG